MNRKLKNWKEKFDQIVLKRNHGKWAFWVKFGNTEPSKKELEMNRQKKVEESKILSLAEILPETLQSIKDLAKVTDQKVLDEVFFVGIGDARLLSVKGLERIVVLVNSPEEGHAAISESFPLAMREYFWSRADKTTGEEKRFKGFQFFTDSCEKAEQIKNLLPQHSTIPKNDQTRVSCCAMSTNVSLRWLARRFIQQNVHPKN